MSEKDEAITKVYSALGNPIRRRIVSLLRSKGKAGFKELHDSLRISIGALYHHLEALEGLVTQGPDKKYMLTEQGKKAIETLSVSEEKIITEASQFALSETRLAFLSKELLLGRTVFNYLNREPVRSLPISLMIVVLGGWVSLETNLEPLLLFFLNPTAGISRAWFLLLFPIGWLATFAVTDVLTIVLYKRRGGELSLLNGTAFAMLPLLVVPGIFFVQQLLGASVATENYLILLLPIALQVWVVCLLSSAISLSKGLRIERSAVISLGVIYLNIISLVVALQLRIF